MKVPVLFLFLLLAAGAASPAGAADVVGTAYTVLLRGHGPRQAGAAAQPAPTFGIPGLTTPIRRPATPVQPVQPQRQPVQPGSTMRLIDGRSGQALSTANYDASIDGYMFRLPMAVDLSRGDVCLVIKNAAGVSIPVRGERGADDGYAFRNPAWQAEAGRLAELATLRAEHAALVGEMDKGTREIDALVAENGGVAAAALCQPGAAKADPPRPAAALEPVDAAGQAGAVCALSWERAFQDTSVDPARLFGEAGFAADWAGRAAAAPVAQALPRFPLDFRGNDTRTIYDAAAKGRAYLEHAEGLKAMVRVHNTCKADVARLAAAAVAAWQNAIAQARNAPQLAKAACEQRSVRIEQLRAAQARAPNYRRELERRIGALEAGAPPGDDAVRIDGNACNG